jgi:hypothetical protein
MLHRLFQPEVEAAFAAAGRASVDWMNKPVSAANRRMLCFRGDLRERRCSHG